MYLEKDLVPLQPALSGKVEQMIRHSANIGGMNEKN